MQAYFDQLDRVRYEGSKSSNPLAFRHYNPDELVLGKRMEEHLRFAACYWHTFCWNGADMFGVGAFNRPWQQPGEALALAKRKADVAFEFFHKLHVPFYCFHDVDVSPEGASLIGSKEGDKFRKFAQGLTLDNLVHLANQQLTRLHGRYLLQRKASEALEVEVVDTWQADAVRDTRTLSGGESFLVSLALALALSDLVSHKTRIDSLFLDEGFGTLDSETLDTALDALDALNASGKTIGVISHVEAMKERIPVQIKVKKINGLGYSKLESAFAMK